MNQLEDYAEDPLDVVMLTKEWVHSSSVSQAPVLILPRAYEKERLQGAPLNLQPRKDLSKRECDELLDSIIQVVRSATFD